jgi:hypothetical protein
MTHIRLLDADFLINTIRTLSIMDDAIAGNFLEKISNDQHYQWISTNEVRAEVNQKLLLKKTSKDTDLFFDHKKDIIKKNQRQLFQKIRFVPITKCPQAPLLSSTSLRNTGEHSLVILLFCKYHSFSVNQDNSIAIVSNNHKDISIPFRKALKILNCQSRHYDENTMLQENYDYYLELFKQLRIEKNHQLYYLFLSNIDARFVDSKMVDIFQKIIHA